MIERIAAIIGGAWRRFISKVLPNNRKKLYNARFNGAHRSSLLYLLFKTEREGLTERKNNATL